MGTDDRKVAGVNLRLAWAGPWNERSSIGLFGTDIVRELVSQGHRVDVLRTELGADLLLAPPPPPPPVRFIPRQPGRSQNWFVSSTG